jgi:hypothetical protein
MSLRLIRGLGVIAAIIGAIGAPGFQGWEDEAPKGRFSVLQERLHDKDYKWVKKNHTLSYVKRSPDPYPGRVQKWAVCERPGCRPGEEVMITRIRHQETVTVSLDRPKAWKSFLRDPSLLSSARLVGPSF